MISTSERLAQENEIRLKTEDRLRSNLRVAEPGIIESFDEDAQTAQVRLAIREQVNLDGQLSWKEIPVLVDCPIKLFRGGGFSITLPLVKGDECLVVFGDKDMDAWWQSGGVQNWGKRRRHSLSDGYVLPGIYSQPRKLAAYATDALQIRSDNGEFYIEITRDGKIRMHGKDVVVHATNSYSWDVNGYGERVRSLGGGSYELKTWKAGAAISTVTLPINPPEGPGDGTL